MDFGRMYAFLLKSCIVFCWMCTVASEDGNQEPVKSCDSRHRYHFNGTHYIYNPVWIKCTSDEFCCGGKGGRPYRCCYNITVGAIFGTALTGIVVCIMTGCCIVACCVWCKCCPYKRLHEDPWTRVKKRSASQTTEQSTEFMGVGSTRKTNKESVEAKTKDKARIENCRPLEIDTTISMLQSNTHGTDFEPVSPLLQTETSILMENEANRADNPVMSFDNNRGLYE